jgi:hypothetical protein
LVVVSYARTSAPKGPFGCFVRPGYDDTSPKLSALAYQYLFHAHFRFFIICTVKIDSAEQVA